MDKFALAVLVASTAFLGYNVDAVMSEVDNVVAFYSYDAKAEFLACRKIVLTTDVSPAEKMHRFDAECVQHGEAWAKADAEGFRQFVLGERADAIRMLEKALTP